VANLAFQKQEYLNKVLDILADPLACDPLVFRENSLVSPKSYYEVINNIPVMIPSVNDRKDMFTPQVNELWEELQDLEYKMYLEDPVGVFSHGDHESAKMVGELVGLSAKGTCLDVGCGAVSLPSYIKHCPNVEFFGVDPYFGNSDREFPFVQALGEFLPFKEESFDNALIATSLDHVYFPEIVLKNIHRILKEKGKLFIWQTVYEESYIPYKTWRESKEADPTIAVQFDSYHQWAFAEQSLRASFLTAGFVEKSCVTLLENIMADNTRAREILLCLEKRS